MMHIVLKYAKLQGSAKGLLLSAVATVNHLQSSAVLLHYIQHPFVPLLHITASLRC